MNGQTETDLPGDVFIILVALAALGGWVIVRALGHGRLEIGHIVIDRGRQPLLFWGAIGLSAAFPIAYLAYILTTY
jgi:hypothetical protein